MQVTCVGGGKEGRKQDWGQRVIACSTLPKEARPGHRAECRSISFPRSSASYPNEPALISHRPNHWVGLLVSCILDSRRYEPSIFASVHPLMCTNPPLQGMFAHYSPKSLFLRGKLKQVSGTNYWASLPDLVRVTAGTHVFPSPLSVLSSSHPQPPPW